MTKRNFFYKIIATTKNSTKINKYYRLIWLNLRPSRKKIGVKLKNC